MSNELELIADELFMKLFWDNTMTPIRKTDEWALIFGAIEEASYLKHD